MLTSETAGLGAGAIIGIILSIILVLVAGVLVYFFKVRYDYTGG